MQETPAGNVPITDQVERLQRLISTCKKFIDYSTYSSVVIIFSGKYNGYDTTDLVKLDSQDLPLVPMTLLLEFFNTYGANLTAKKLLLENGIAADQVDTFISGIDALKRSIKKNF